MNLDPFLVLNANICQLFIYDLSSAALCLLFLNLEQLCLLGTRSIGLQELKSRVGFFPDSLGFFAGLWPYLLTSKLS